MFVHLESYFLSLFTTAELFDVVVLDTVFHCDWRTDLHSMEEKGMAAPLKEDLDESFLHIVMANGTVHSSPDPFMRVFPVSFAKCNPLARTSSYFSLEPQREREAPRLNTQRERERGGS